MIIIKNLSALYKVFPIIEPPCLADKRLDSVFENEIYSFQVAYTSNDEKQYFYLEPQSDCCEISLYSVGLVPSELPAYPNYDGNYLNTEPGLYPDILRPIEKEDTLFAQPGFWRSIWVDATPLGGCAGGVCRINLKLLSENGELLGESCKEFLIYNAKLPEQELIRTEWFHCDCISNYYNVPMMSEEHWHLMEQYIRFAAGNGINMILTPIFTPPLDTKADGERPTMQLIDVSMEGAEYHFDFNKLKRWIEMCQSCGIKYFEMSHLFTQWGANHAPKIVIETNVGRQKKFGWETEAIGEEYGRFLDALLPELTAHLKELKIADRCFFHVSDEPQIKDLENYKAAKNKIAKHLEGFNIIDALSDIEFYKMGLIKNPICATDHIQPFLDEGIEGLWVYYCCAQNTGVSNRFMAMPSARNRIIGVQLYKYDIVGFLHWGFNFWNSQYSIKNLNPYEVTDADCAFPSGDPFLVYPGKDGPIPSIRLKVFGQALYDLRALKLLESVSSKEHVLEILEEGLDKQITFCEYPQDLQYFFQMRRKVNDEIAQRMNIHNIK